MEPNITFFRKSTEKFVTKPISTLIRISHIQIKLYITTPLIIQNSLCSRRISIYTAWFINLKHINDLNVGYINLK